MTESPYVRLRERGSTQGPGSNARRAVLSDSSKGKALADPLLSSSRKAKNSWVAKRVEFMNSFIQRRFRPVSERGFNYYKERNKRKVLTPVNVSPCPGVKDAVGRLVCPEFGRIPLKSNTLSRSSRCDRLTR